MKQLTQVLLAGALLLLTSCADGRRVRVRPQQHVDEDQDSQPEQAQYYTQPQQQTVDLLPDPYNGLYGRPSQRGQTDIEYRPRASATRAKEPPKQPPVATIRNYSKVNDDGSFTFGYEAADGSFKEETRGTDCVVRGKYGYVDPDGNKREFTYVSGNPCDPNSLNDEAESKEEVDDSGEENVPKGPFRPLRPLRPTPAPLPRPTTTLYQEDFTQDEETVDDAPQQVHQTVPVYRTQTATTYQQATRPTTTYYSPTSYVEQDTPRPVLRPQPAVRITPRPPVSASTIRTQLPATTYRPQLVQVTATPRPGVIYSKQAATTPAIDFDEELRKFQLENSIATTPRVRPQHVQHQHVQQQHVQHQPQQQVATKAQQGSAEPVYETQLVYDPATGQYNTVLYQQLAPKSSAGFSLNHRLQGYVQPPAYSQVYAQQQQAALLQRSQQLYAQQQQQRAVEQQQQQHQHRFQQAKTTSTPRYPAYQQQQDAQQAGFYYVQPQAADQGAGLSHGQIDAFLRGHNIAF